MWKPKPSIQMESKRQTVLDHPTPPVWPRPRPALREWLRRGISQVLGMERYTAEPWKSYGWCSSIPPKKHQNRPKNSKKSWFFRCFELFRGGFSGVFSVSKATIFLYFLGTWFIQSRDSSWKLSKRPVPRHWPPRAPAPVLWRRQRWGFSGAS